MSVQQLRKNYTRHTIKLPEGLAQRLCELFSEPDKPTVSIQKAIESLVTSALPHGYLRQHFVVGQEVWDDLTKTFCKVVGVEYANGKVPDQKHGQHHCWGIWLDNEYLDGGRHPWEVTDAAELRAASTAKLKMSLAEACMMTLGGVGAISPRLYAKALEDIASLTGRANDGQFRGEVTEILKTFPCPLD